MNLNGACAKIEAMNEMKTIYLVPHSHYDVVWAFTKEDYYFINEMILTNAVKMIKESDFKFLIEQTYLLEMIEERNPKLFAGIKKAIAVGKIEIADGQYIMPDLMIPAAEVLVREILFGKRYCKEKFGIDVPVAWAADGFGLNAQMPQVYKKSGYKWLAFRRGLPETIGYRVSEFMWEGLDGSQILSHWMPLGYRAGLDLDKWDEAYEKLSAFAITSHMLMPCGSGGVPPQEETPDKVAQWNREHDDSRMIISTPSDFFKNLEEDGDEFATFHGELYSSDLQNIFPDVVSSRIGLKLAIKNCENLLLTSEKISTVAWIFGMQYPSDAMTEMWRKMLFLANHDVLPSCGIDEIYEEAWDYIADMNKMAKVLLKDAAEHFLKDSGPGNGIVVLNPNNWEVTDWVETEVQLGEGWNEELGVALNGEEIASEVIQVQRREDGSVCKAKLCFVATVPSLGYRVYQIVKKNKQFQSDVEVRGNGVVNKYFKLAIDDKTGVLEVFDMDDRKILEGNELVIDQEIGDLYFHRSEFDGLIHSESGEGIHFGTFKPDECKIETSPVRTVITFKDSFYCLQWPYYLTKKFGSILQRHKTIDVLKKVIVYNDIPRIDFITTINSQQSHIRIRLKFDTCMVIPAYCRQTQFGVIDLPLPTSLDYSIKAPSVNWVNCQEGRRGLAFFTRGVPLNEIKAGEIYCTLLRSVSVLSTDGSSGPLIPTPYAMELGEHTYIYAVYPHSGDWKETEIHRRGHEFTYHLLAFQMDTTALDKELRSFTLEPDNLIISALKKAEKEDAVILRFFETKGQTCQAQLQMPVQIKAAKCVNLLEEEESELKVENGELRMEVNPFEIVTLKLLFDT
ncbi:MAG: glycoside hydrolase [Chloroflexi bacterium]|nr:glycoside hydrolase [Chloroflexota bacterium]